jgi:hypothetical protein
MKQIIFIILLALSWTARATIHKISAGESATTIQSTINDTRTGDTVSFGAGRYRVTAPIVLKCGVTYTGPVADPAVAILSSSMGESHSLFYLYSNPDLTNPCTQATTIEYLGFVNSGGIYVQASYTNLSILHNQFGNLPCCNSSIADQAIYFGGGTTTSNIASVLTNATISYNTFGDITSCTYPTNAMTDRDSPEDYEGACNGMMFSTSIDGLTVTYNNFYHVAEGVHITCPNYVNQQFPCEPPGGAITNNITAEYNDFSNIHRITWEEQPQQSSGIITFEYNSEHDWFMPYFGSFGLSMACCYNGTSTFKLNGSNNVVIFNTNAGSSGRYGYGMEAMGRGAIYNNILMQSADSPANAAGIAYGCGPVESVSNNTVQGDFSNYIENEGLAGCGTDTTPASLTANVTSSTVSAVTSVAPAISPPAGSATFPLSVTLTDTGYTSGAQPLGNTGIWYTTDGTTPVPGSGSAQYLGSGGKFVLSSPATVKAVGMWGALNQPKSYASGFGFVPSPIVTATFRGGSGPRLVSAYLVPKGGVTSIPVGRSLQFIAHGVYSDGTSAVLPDSDGNVVTAWNTNNHAVAKISTLGHVTGMGLGAATIEGFIGNLEATPSKLTVTQIVASSLHASIVEPAPPAMIESPSSSMLLAAAPQVAGPPIADKFPGPLWAAVTPNGGSASIFDGHLIIRVPGGSNHDTTGPSNEAARVLQPIGNTDFDVSIKIDSKVGENDAGTSQGLIALSNNDDFISFALTSDGTNIGLLARTVNEGQATTVLEDTTLSQYQSPTYLRLTRSGVAYIAWYSFDGAHWTQATSFTYAENLTFIGPFASNYNNTPAKAVPVVMSVDWFNVG